MISLGLLADPLTITLLVVGIVLGMMIGILPGLGPPIAIALALPFTFYMETIPSMILLLGIYSAAIYGGSISAIAVGIPGTGAAIATVQDGHKMFKAGRGGEALGFSLTGSIIGGLFSVVCLVVISPLLASLAVKFGPREYLAISVFGLIVVVRVAGKSLPKGLLMGTLGIFLTTWGLDELNGTERFTFGTYHLYEGLPLVPFLVGVFAVSEVLIGSERALQKTRFNMESLKVKLPGLKTLVGLKDVILRSSIIGTIIGIIPGEGAAVGAFFAYSEAKRRSRNPEAYGTGIPEGIIAPETANNATVGGALVPTLTLGVPGSPAAAVLLGALLIQGLTLDELNGTERFTFGTYHLYEGLPLVPFLVGVFAVSEVLIGSERALQKTRFNMESLKVKLPGLKTLVGLKDVILRSSIIGTIIGIIPGEGAAVGAFFAYSEAKRRSRNPEAYGTGIPEGIIAPETANNATVGGALVPTLTLGVPGSPAAAVLLGALLIQGLTPGPKLFSDRPDLMYAIFIGLFVINILMMFIGLVAIRFAARLIMVPTSVIVPTVLLLSFVGIYSVSYSFFNVGVLLGAGILGYVVRKLGYSIAPLSIGFVLGPILENSLRQSLTIADGSFFEFFNTPIGLTIYAILVLTILWGPIISRFRRSSTKA